MTTTSNAPVNLNSLIGDSAISSDSRVYRSTLRNSSLIGTFANRSHFVDSPVEWARIDDSNLVNTIVSGTRSKPIDIAGADIVNGWIDETHPLLYATGSEVKNKKKVTVKPAKDGEKAQQETVTTTFPGIKMIAYWVQSEDNTGVPTTFNILCDGVTFEGPGAVEAVRQAFLEGGMPAHWASAPADQKEEWIKAIAKGLDLIAEKFTLEEVQRVQEELDVMRTQEALDALTTRLFEKHLSDIGAEPASSPIVAKVQGGTWNIGANAADPNTQVSEPPPPSL